MTKEHTFEFELLHIVYDPDKQGALVLDKQKDISWHIPEDIPQSWYLFNAPRPIYGHFYFSWKFSSGVIYAAVDPKQDYAASYIHRNKQQDAALVRFITQKEMLDYVVIWYAINIPEYLERYIDLWNEPDKWPKIEVRNLFDKLKEKTATITITGEIRGLI